MISTTKASEEREVGDMRGFPKWKRLHFGKIFKTSGESPLNQTLNLYHIK